jgi:hypothetical protein
MQESLGLWSEAGPGKKTRPYPKNNYKQKGLGGGSRGRILA